MVLIITMTNLRHFTYTAQNCPNRTDLISLDINGNEPSMVTTWHSTMASEKQLSEQSSIQSFDGCFWQLVS